GAGLDAALDHAHGEARLVGRAVLARVVHDGLAEAAGVALDDLVDDAVLHGLLEGEIAARDHHLDGQGLAHEADEPLRAARAGEHAQVDLGQADLAAVLARDAQVRRHGDLQAAAHGVAV